MSDEEALRLSSSVKLDSQGLLCLLFHKEFSRVLEDSQDVGPRWYLQAISDNSFHIDVKQIEGEIELFYLWLSQKSESNI